MTRRARRVAQQLSSEHVTRVVGLCGLHIYAENNRTNRQVLTETGSTRLTSMSEHAMTNSTQIRCVREPSALIVLPARRAPRLVLVVDVMAIGQTAEDSARPSRREAVGTTVLDTSET